MISTCAHHRYHRQHHCNFAGLGVSQLWIKRLDSGPLPVLTVEFGRLGKTARRIRNDVPDMQTLCLYGVLSASSVQRDLVLLMVCRTFAT